MRISYILGEFPSTSEYFILNEILELRKRGISISILALNKPRNLRHGVVACKELLSSTVYYNPYSLKLFVAHFYNILHYSKKYYSEVIKILRAFLKSPIRALKMIKYFNSAIFFIFIQREEKIKHVHAHFASLPATIASIISRITSVPYSVSAHAQDLYVENVFLYNKINEAKFVVTCTAANKTYLEKRTNKRNIVHIYHGINISIWPYKERGYTNPFQKVKFLVVARLIEKKGIIYLLKALNILKNKIDFECLIVGDGKERGKLERYVQDSLLLDKVTFLGSLPQESLVNMYHKSDFFILPCIISDNDDRDGLPNVLLEALATGIPVITTAISAISELIVDQKNGILVPVKDEQAIAVAIDNLLMNPDMIKKISIEGRKTVENNFKIDDCINQLYDLFRKEIMQ